MANDVFKVGDQVEVIFSGMHVQIGRIKHVLNTENYKYIVTTKINGKECDVYCNERDLKSI